VFPGRLRGARRKWLGERAYADLVALCQFLPSPASSQVGMAIGLQRAGYGGMLAAWAAFTLPSAVLLVAFAYGASALGTDAGIGWIQGLKAAAVLAMLALLAWKLPAWAVVVAAGAAGLFVL
jgi:chromate transporter